jgi:hypothetical protein
MDEENKPTQFFVRFRNAGVFAIFVALVVVATIATPEQNFIRVTNLQTLLSLGSEFGVVVLGVGLLMIAGEFDLSVGSVLALCSLIFTWLIELAVNPFVAALITLACGSLVGKGKDCLLYRHIGRHDVLERFDSDTIWWNDALRSNRGLSLLYQSIHRGTGGPFSCSGHLVSALCGDSVACTAPAAIWQLDLCHGG